jgi:ATP-dependent helicase HepA
MVRFYPAQFNLKSMYNAKYCTPPNMEEALVRSGRVRNLIITGTFNRDVAVYREDLVFYAPGEPWTDSIIRNAAEADRGRCCAILRVAPELEQGWQGFELLYTLQVNPRRLYDAGFDPVHLLRAQGYLFTSTFRMLISTDGEIARDSSPIWKIVRDRPFSKVKDVHLGGRGSAQILAFKKKYPIDLWHAMLKQVFSIAEQTLEQEFSFTADLSEEADEQFRKTASGLKAAQYWLYNSQGLAPCMDSVHIEEYERISAALVEGIRHPLWRLESAC